MKQTKAQKGMQAACTEPPSLELESGCNALACPLPSAAAPRTGRSPPVDVACPRREGPERVARPLLATLLKGELEFYFLFSTGVAALIFFFF